MPLKNAILGSLIAMAVVLPTWTRAETAAPRLYPNSMLVTRDRFSDEILGEGPDLVFIPGLASSRATWKAEADRLKDRFRIHLIQIAGFAGEPARANATGEVFAPTAEALDAYLLERRLTPATVIGHSLGGTMALYLAEHHGDHLKKILVVDALPFYSVLMGGPGATVDSARPMAERIRATTTRSPNMDRVIASMVTSEDNRALVNFWGEESDASAVNRAAADDMELDLRPGLAGIATPITLLYPDYAPAGSPPGATDGMYGQAYATAPHKTLLRIDNSLHFIMLDQPAAFAAALDRFLKD